MIHETANALKDFYLSNTGSDVYEIFDKHFYFMDAGPVSINVPYVVLSIIPMSDVSTYTEDADLTTIRFNVFSKNRASSIVYAEAIRDWLSGETIFPENILSVYIPRGFVQGTPFRDDEPQGRKSVFWQVAIDFETIIEKEA